MQTERAGFNKKRTKRRIIAWIVISAILSLIIVFCAVFGLQRYNFCIPKDVTWLKSMPITHRGLHNETFDENSMGAFENAVNHHYAIEFDLRQTKDGTPVVFHDADLSRLIGLDKNISDMSITEIKDLKLPRSGEAIPTFQELLDMVNGKAPLLIEIKDYGIPGKFETTILEILSSYKGEYVIQSYNPFVCSWVKKHSPKTTVGLLLNDISFLKSRFGRSLKDNIFSLICTPNFIAYNYDLIEDGMMDIYRSNNISVLGFGLHETDLQSKEYLKKVDNIIFELSDDPPPQE